MGSLKACFGRLVAHQGVDACLELITIQDSINRIIIFKILRAGHMYQLKEVTPEAGLGCLATTQPVHITRGETQRSYIS